MKTDKIFNSYRYGSAATPSTTNACISMKMVMSICCLSLLILILMSSKMSMGQKELSVLQRPNIVLNETESKASQNTTEKIVASDVLRSATRNQYNNTNEQYATVLVPRSDGSIYSGVITFTASEPVKIEIQHSISLDNNTVNSRQLQGIIKYSNNQPISASSILPNYSNGNFSSSIFFTGKALAFTYEKPFVVMYTVSAGADKVTNNESLAKSTNTTRMESLAPPTAYPVNAGTLLTALIPRVSDEYLRELPFSDLDPSQLSLIIVKVPADKAGLILSKISIDKREEILSKIPADKRQEIMKNLTKQ
jgi:hypothetical protein